MIGLTSLPHPPIDIHSHFNHGSPFDCPTAEIGMPNTIHNRTLEYLENEYAYQGIRAVGFSTFASVMEHAECIVEENEYLFALSREKEWVYQWVVIDPRQPETYRQAERMLPYPKTLGIKLHPSNHGYDFEAYADEMYAFAAEHKAVILIHPSYIDKMSFYADRHPDMKLILAHLGSPEHIEAVKNAKHGNIYTDTSGGLSRLNNIVEYAVEQIGSERILFGTDTYSMAFQLGRIALSHLSDTDKENILYKNAFRLFPNAFQK